MSKNNDNKTSIFVNVMKGKLKVKTKNNKFVSACVGIMLVIFALGFFVPKTISAIAPHGLVEVNK